MKKCKNCFITNIIPGSNFNKNGLCNACAINRPKINWESRLKHLKKISINFKNKSTNYDCIVPVSGGKDSTRQAFFVRDNLKMNPLLVTLAYPPEQQTIIGAQNFENLISNGFDGLYVSLSPKTWKKMMKYSFYKFGNIFKSCEQALFATAPIVAIREQINLIIYGENAGLQWGYDAHVSKGGDANNLRNSNTLSGGGVEKYIDSGFMKKKLFWYDYPTKEDFLKNKISMIFLGYFIRNFNDNFNAAFSIKKGLKTRKGFDANPKNTGNIENFDALDDDFVFVNQFIKYKKFGMGKVSEQVSVKLREGKISKKRAKFLVERYDGKCSKKYINKFCEYIGITQDEFVKVVERFKY